jgi:4-carboxymuconolactone decarboxylase
MTNLNRICMGALGLGLVALAWTDPALNLRGDRFKPLTYEQLTPQQKTMMDHLLAGDRGGTTTGPFNVFLRSPEMGDLAQQLGAQIRFHSSIPRPLNEMAILITARFWGAQYEWQSHHRLALQAGLSPAIIEAIANGKKPANLKAEEDAVYTFCHELLTTKQVSDATFQAAVSKFGERGAVDLINAMGYYTLVSLALNTDRYPLNERTQPELKPLKE